MRKYLESAEKNVDKKSVFRFYNKMAASVFDLDNVACMLENGKTDRALALLRKRADLMRELCDDFRTENNF